jgi:hypothetical protein
MRQSVGKRVKNKLAAACFAKPGIESLAWLWVARIRNSLLLKTASRNPALWSSSRVTGASIVALRRLTQCGFPVSNRR